MPGKIVKGRTPSVRISAEGSAGDRTNFRVGTRVARSRNVQPPPGVDVLYVAVGDILLEIETKGKKILPLPPPPPPPKGELDEALQNATGRIHISIR